MTSEVILCEGHKNRYEIKRYISFEKGGGGEMVS